MTVVERHHGKAEDSELNGNTIVTITLQGIVPIDGNALDRILQGALIEADLDIAWKDSEPPTTQPGVVEAEPVS